jgi:2-polyprenyl-3-methyl-5-hydroxy-6-metoxy-1,4-benzoquinol methylase
MVNSQECPNSESTICVLSGAPISKAAIAGPQQCEERFDIVSTRWLGRTRHGIDGCHETRGPTRPGIQSPTYRGDMPEPDAAEVIAQNKTYWEALAGHRRGQPIEFFERGGSALNDDELAAVGEVRGRRVLQLACSTGDEALTLARLGADVSGVDIAPTHLQTARAKAEALDLDIDFVEGDMMQLEPEIRGFDVVFISWGGLCWAPSIDAWARSVADRLNPGGRLVISEHHPLWEVLTVTESGALMVSGDYFGAARDGYADPMKAPEITRRVDVPPLPHRSFVWSIGSVVTAVLGAGLTLRSFREFPEAEMYAGLAEATSLPATYLLMADR